MEFKELIHFLENITITDLAPHFISYIKDHRYMKNHDISFDFLKTIDASITIRNEIYKKFKPRLTHQIKILIKKALDSCYLKRYSYSVYETTNKIKINSPSETISIFQGPLKYRVFTFLNTNPNASFQELCKNFPDQNRGTLSDCRSCYLINNKIKKKMTKQIFTPEKFPMARKKEKITSQKKLRYLSISGKIQLCVVWKEKGKSHRQIVFDKKFGGQIKWADARRNSLTAEKVFATPTTT